MEFGSFIRVICSDFFCDGDRRVGFLRFFGLVFGFLRLYLFLCFKIFWFIVEDEKKLEGRKKYKMWIFYGGGWLDGG